MSRAVLIIANEDIRRKAIHWASKARPGSRIEFKGPKRTLPQNARFWASLTDIATQVMWHGLRLSADDWRLIFLDALHREMRIVPNLDGTGFVNLGRSSSDLSVSEMSDCLELIYSFGATHNVRFHDGERA